MVVVDCSVALALVLPDEDSPYADGVLAYLSRENQMPVVPALFRWEFINALMMAQRRKRITDAQFQECSDRWLMSELQEDAMANEKTAITLAGQHRLTIYDALYLELAIRRKLKLATLDAVLAKAAGEEGVGFVS